MVDHEATQVLRIVTRLNIGGPSRQVLSLTQGLPDRGFSSELAFGMSGDREGNMCDGAHLQHTLIPKMRREINPLNDLQAYRNIRELLRTRQPTIVHTHMAKAGALGRIAASQIGIPYIVHTFHGHVLEGYFSPAVNRTLVEIERRLARRTDALIAVSGTVRDALIELGIGVPDQWRVVPLGLDLDYLVKSSKHPAVARRSLGLPVRVPLVGIVGRLASIKDLPTFLAACGLITSSNPDVQFVVAGDGPLREELERRGTELLGPRIRFLGWVDDLAALYSALDLVLLTSLNEGTPVALIEAAAAGKPVVSTNVGGVSDVVLDNKSGFLVSPGEPASIADRANLLLGDQELAARFGAAGREYVSAQFSSERLLSDIAALYAELMESRGSDLGAVGFRNHHLNNFSKRGLRLKADQRSRLRYIGNPAEHVLET